ncbi:MAG: hypothetical protein VX460_08300 [Planctomycetota bacterium]|nr:hypothetical protein [Planctomycetota bacterium]
MDPKTSVAAKVLEDVFERVACDLSMVVDREVEVHSVGYEERRDRAAGAAVVHISFRFGVRAAGPQVHHGALLVPLPEAITVAGYLMMAPEARVVAMRESGDVDTASKKAMIQVGAFVASATEAALRAAGVAFDGVHFDGCQGVRADVPPRLQYMEGAPLATSRAMVSIGGRPPAEFLIMLPREDYLLGGA